MAHDAADGAEQNARRLAIVSVVFEPEFGMLLVQARSMARYVPPAALQEIVVIDNSRRGMPEALREELLHGYGPLRPAVSILRPADIGRIPRTTGWRSQQLLKLHVARSLSAPRYVVLDAKNHFVGPYTPGLFQTADGRMRARYLSYTSHPMRRHLERVLARLEVDPAQHVPRFTHTTTPFVLDVPLVTAMMDDIEARSGHPFARDFIAHDLTEFFLVAGWLVARGHALEDVYEPGLDVGPIVWPRKATADHIADAVRRATELETTMFGVHRLAIARLDAPGARTLARFWAERGLFASDADAERFLTGVRRDLERYLRGQRRHDLSRKLATAPRTVRRRSARLRRRIRDAVPPGR